MAIVNTSGTLVNSTASTGTRVTLTGQAQWIYLSVYAQTYFKWAPATVATGYSTGTGTGIGMTASSGDVYVFQVQPGEAKYFMHVATGAQPYYIMEVV